MSFNIIKYYLILLMDNQNKLLGFLNGDFSSFFFLDSSLISRDWICFARGLLDCWRDSNPHLILLIMSIALPIMTPAAITSMPVYVMRRTNTRCCYAWHLGRLASAPNEVFYDQNNKRRGNLYDRMTFVENPVTFGISREWKRRWK